jgi:tetratricopeptide (TPR) repeat protein
MKKLFFILTLFISQFAIGQGKVDSLLNVLKTTKQDTTKVNTYNNLFLEVEFTDEAKAKEYLTKALKLSKKIDFKKGLGATYLYLGFFADDKGNYPEALKNYFTSLKIREAIGDKNGVADSYNNIGLVYMNQGNYPEALKNYFACLKIKEAIGDKNGIATSYNNIGLVYLSQGNYPEALKNYFAGLKIYEAIGDKNGIANSYNNIGLVYYEQGNYLEALKNYFAGLKIFEAIVNKNGIGISYNNIGLVYSHQGNYPEALKNYFACLKIKEAIGDKSGIAASYLNIGSTKLKLDKTIEAKQYLENGLNLSKEIGAKEWIRNSYDGLAQVDSITGNFKSQVANYKLYILYRDSLDNEETRKKTIQSQMTYDFEKKEAVAAAEHKSELKNQAKIAEEKNRKQKLVTYFVIGGLLLVMIFAGFVFRSLRLTKKQKVLIEKQKLAVEQHQKEIIDSIHYAKRIQTALLPSNKNIEKNIKRLKKD